MHLKSFNFNILYIFSDVIIGLPGDDDSIEIDENNHEECFRREHTRHRPSCTEAHDFYRLHSNVQSCDDNMFGLQSICAYNLYIHSL